MGFWGLLGVASMPILQVLIISAIGAFMATDYLNLLPSNTRNSLNKIVFVVFTPSLIFTSLVESVTFHDIISMWFMPINIGITFLCGGILGWIAVKLIKPKPHLEGLIMAMCSTGNYANLLVIMVPAICTDNGSPFGDHGICKAKALSYASFSMAWGSFYTWTCTYQMMQASALKYNTIKETEELSNHANQNTHILDTNNDHIDQIMPSSNLTSQDIENQCIVQQTSVGNVKKKDGSISDKLVAMLKKIVNQLLAPPTLGSFAGLIIGAIPWIKHLLTGEKAPLRVIQDSMILLGAGTIPCLTLILGGNLTQGLRKASVGPTIIITVMLVRYLILPVIGIGVIKMAANMGLVPVDPLFRFVLLIMFALPPGINISTMAELFSVGQEECAMLMMWTYLAAAFALTTWSSVYMWILS
ncbi:hypothetical protein Lser_V15G12188 [Lactuca serriola]